MILYSSDLLKIKTKYACNILNFTENLKYLKLQCRLLSNQIKIYDVKIWMTVNVLNKNCY